ncbi:hypothetical protein JHU04_002519 [Brenneria sp. 4F2]|nr:hypothetical protein [Brenneria bubanii]
MTTYKTGNPIGSAAAKDLFDNAQNFDKAVNELVTHWIDRLGVQRLTEYGRQQLFDQLIESIKEEGEDAISSVGWQEAGDWAVGLQLKNRNQIVLYNGSWYKFLGELPHTISGDSPENDGGIWSSTNTSGAWVNIGDATIRSSLIASDGFKLIGQADTIDIIRNTEPTNSNQSILLRRHNANTTLGGGEFFYDSTDTTTEDNDCTVVVTSGGARWKRKGVHDLIHAEWAGVLGVRETDDPQDDAFDNLIKAAAVGSPFGAGYPNKVIKGLQNDRIRLARRHYIRGGKYNINDTIGNTDTLRALRFGIDGAFVLDGQGGFFCVQMVNAYFNIVVDNSGVTLATTPTISEYALRLEALVISPDINVKASQYSGTGYYQLGKYGAATETAAVWSDLTNALPGATNLDHATFNIESCGRAFYWKSGGAGLGHIDSIWVQNCKSPSYFYDLQDFSFTTWEDYIPVVGADDTAAGVAWDQCGGHFGKLLTGPGGRPNHSIINGSVFDIGHLFTNQGNAQGITDPAYHTGIEIYNATVHAATAQGNHPNGRVAVVGGASVLHIGSLYATFTGQVISLGNSNLVSVTDKNQCTPKVVIDSFIGQRVNNSAYVNNAYKPPFYIDSTVSDGGSLTVNNARFENFNNGFTSQDNLYIFRCDSDASGALHINNGQFPNLAYPIYCKKPDNIGGFKNNKFGNSKIYFSDGSSTTYGGSASSSDKFISYFSGITLSGSSFTNNGITPILYSCRIKITTASDVSIFVNGREVFYANDAGTYSFSCTLQYRDTIYASGTTANAEISTQAISYARQIS